jgi:CMP-N-acetylneuraminic acid synthetase
MNKLGVTLARGGSKGVPKKNIRMIAGKPLLAWTVEEAMKCTLIDKYVVSSDCDEILEMAKLLGADVIKRPAELARDDTPHVPALLHALDLAEDRYDRLFEIVVDIRCTNPLKTSFDIDSAVRMMEETHADVIQGVSEAPPVERIKREFNGRLVDTYPEPPEGLRQFLPKYWIRNGSIYVVMADALRQGILNTGSEDIRPYKMPDERSINIDKMKHFYAAEGMLNARKRSQTNI